MSDETEDDGYGADIFCGGPLVFDERISEDIEAGIVSLKVQQQLARLARSQNPPPLESPPAKLGAVEVLRRAEVSAESPAETWRRFRDSALRSMVKRELAEEIVSVEEWDEATRVVIQIPVCDPLSWGDPEPDIMAVTRDIARS